ncbi:hypothetical protein H6501_05825 [Candidatus Woesearchaeota archaeon]|nr:hypothetical protein [Nanoarchaeota archaeon]MCB9371092.1 hypothetical protein [Candidatus Woesearchaeota archaeon]USN44191.1 MAG: hypothetical protein H6500_07425 [Candidatus Woesearchaeota archaeon]
MNSAIITTAYTLQEGLNALADRNRKLTEDLVQEATNRGIPVSLYCGGDRAAAQGLEKLVQEEGGIFTFGNISSRYEQRLAAIEALYNKTGNEEIIVAWTEGNKAGIVMGLEEGIRELQANENASYLPLARNAQSLASYPKEQIEKEMKTNQYLMEKLGLPNGSDPLFGPFVGRLAFVLEQMQKYKAFLKKIGEENNPDLQTLGDKEFLAARAAALEMSINPLRIAYHCDEGIKAEEQKNPEATNKKRKTQQQQLYDFADRYAKDYP